MLKGAAAAAAAADRQAEPALASTYDPARPAGSDGGCGGSSDGETLTWVLRRNVLRHALVLEHVQQRSLASVIEAEKEDLGILVGQACERERSERQYVRSAAQADRPYWRPATTATPGHRQAVLRSEKPRKEVPCTLSAGSRAAGRSERAEEPMARRLRTHQGS